MLTNNAANDVQSDRDESLIWSFVFGNITSISISVLLYYFTGRVFASEPSFMMFLDGVIGLLTSIYFFIKRLI